MINSNADICPLCVLKYPLRMSSPFWRILRILCNKSTSFQFYHHIKFFGHFSHPGSKIGFSKCTPYFIGFCIGSDTWYFSLESGNNSGEWFWKDVYELIKYKIQYWTLKPPWEWNPTQNSLPSTFFGSSMDTLDPFILKGLQPKNYE